MTKTRKHYNPPLLIKTWAEEDNESQKNTAEFRQGATGILLALAFGLLAMVLLMSSCVQAKEVITEPNIDGYSLNQWCNAIYKAEGGAKTHHPYGILKRYATTTPLQACKNTVRHKYSDWVKEGRAGTFVAYLGAKYCPVGCDNDRGTNKYWISNVKYWLRRE